MEVVDLESVRRLSNPANAGVKQNVGKIGFPRSPVGELNGILSWPKHERSVIVHHLTYLTPNERMVLHGERS